MTGHRTDKPHEPGTLADCWQCQRDHGPFGPQHAYTSWTVLILTEGVREVRFSDPEDAAKFWLRAPDERTEPVGTLHLVACGAPTRGFCGHCDAEMPRFFPPEPYGKREATG